MPFIRIDLLNDSITTASAAARGGGHLEQMHSVVALQIVFSRAAVPFSGTVTPHCSATKTNLNVDNAKSANCWASTHTHLRVGGTQREAGVFQCI